MDDRGGRGSLVLALGTFHTIALVIALVWLAYRGSGLGSTLASLNTLVGLALFIALWAIALFTTRRALAGIDFLSDDPYEMGTFFWRALRWGAVTGMLFLLVLGVVGLVGSLVAASRGPFQLTGLLFFALFYGSIGAVVSAAIGGVIGVTLGAVDIAALRIARALTNQAPGK
jgi:hypothetical protein